MKIMEEDFDLENPITIDSDPIPSLFASESVHMTSQTYSQSFITRDADASVRRDTISFILKSQFSFDPFVAYLAVNYLDRFLSKQGIPKSEPWILKLLSISCISLAAKMKKSTFSLTSFQSEEGIIFDTQTIQRMELLILGALKWRMRSVTPFAFIQFFLSFFKRKDPPLKQALKARATQIIFKAQNEVKILEYKPSVIAASALLSASHELFPLQFPCFRKAISSCVYINKEKLLDCCKLMQGVVMDGYESILLDEVWSSDTPVNVLDRHSLSLESEKTSSISIGCAVMRSEAGTKKRKISDFCCNSSSSSSSSSSNETFRHLSQQMQHC